MEDFEQSQGEEQQQDISDVGSFAPEQEQVSVGNENAVNEQPKQPELVALDSLERFKYQGKEMTLKELQKSMMLQSDYTKKAQEIAKERKFLENYSYDLEAVEKNPALAEQFKKIYPKSYHAMVDRIIRNSATQQTQAQTQQQAEDPRYQSLQSELETIKNHFREQEIQNIQASLDAKFKDMKAKYPFAREKEVTADAERMLANGEPVTDEVWDELFKQSHADVEAIYKNTWSSKVQNQKQSNGKAKDVSNGGGLPGKAPYKPRTIKEAAELAMKAMNGE